MPWANKKKMINLRKTREKKPYLLNGFSPNMLEIIPLGMKVRFKKVGSIPPLENLDPIIGDKNLARILGCEKSKRQISLKKGDVAYTIQVQGGKIPDDADTLPENIWLNYTKVEII